MRRAAHSFLLMTAAVIAASASAAADSKTTPPANLRGTTAPAASANPNIPVPVQAKEIAPVQVAKNPAAKSADAKQPTAKHAEVKQAAVKHSEIKQATAKHVEMKQAAATHSQAKQAVPTNHPETKLAATKHRSAKHVAAKKTPVKRVAHVVPSHGVAVPLDEVRVLQFSQPVSTVYVGNPAIADVSVIDPRHVFVLGKAFGETNMVALDATGKQVTNDHVSVFGHTGSMVTLHRGAAQVTYTCAGIRCEGAPTPGDDEKSYSTRLGQMTTHQQWGLKSAGLATDEQSQSH
jgi:hypothetical protein